MYCSDSFNYLYASYISVAELRFVPYINLYPRNSRLFRSTDTLNVSSLHRSTPILLLTLLH